MLWLKLMKSPLARTGGASSREHINNLESKLNVNEQYKETFRTNSYIEIWSKVQCQLRRTSDERPSSLSPFPSCTHLLEPPQDILIHMIQTLDLHHLLIDYFEGSLEACNICGFLLQSIDQTRANYRIIQRIIKLAKRASNFGDYKDDQCRVIFDALASFSTLEDPLTVSSTLQFDKIHDRYNVMLDRLTTTRKKIAKRAKLVSLCKKAWRVSLILVCGALAIVTLVLAVHSFIGIVAAPALVTVPFVFLKKRMKYIRRGFKTNTLTRLGVQLDAAAKGIYIINRDFETMSRLVVRLHDEIEHWKSIASLCVWNGKKQMLKEVVREFEIHESCFLEQLGELEQHVYLCFLNINRARRLVIQETLVH